MQACIAHYTPLGTPELCIFAQYVLPFITSRFFVMQNLYDSWQLKNIYKVSCTTYNQNLEKCNAAEMLGMSISIQQPWAAVLVYLHIPIYLCYIVVYL